MLSGTTQRAQQVNKSFEARGANYSHANPHLRFLMLLILNNLVIMLYFYEYGMGQLCAMHSQAKLSLSALSMTVYR